ncbi:MAG: hypothetical protein ACKVQA_21380 [Burkholderiales bacterium]
MFDIMPPELPVNTPTVVVQDDSWSAQLADRSRSGKPKRYENVFTECNDVETASDSPNSAFSPILQDILNRFTAFSGGVQWRLKYQPKVTQLSAPKHGTVTSVEGPEPYFRYKSHENYAGKDQVIYLVEIQGRRFKVVINFWVGPVYEPKGDEDLPPKECLQQNFDDLG